MDAAEDQQLVQLRRRRGQDRRVAAAAAAVGPAALRPSCGWLRAAAGSSVTKPPPASVSSIRSSCFSPALMRGSSISRLRITVRTCATSGEIFSRYASSRQGSGPLL